MNRIRNSIPALLGLLVLAALTGCSVPEPILTNIPTQAPTTQPAETDTPTPTQQPIETDKPTPLPTVIPQPTAMSSPFPEPQPYPTPEWTPYEDEPFTIVFQRDGEIWLSEIGGRGEWALTRERPEWGAGEFAVSPDGQTIAFVAGDEEMSTCIKLVSIKDGTTRVLAGKDDPYREFNVMWWDATHVAFQILNDPVPGYEEDPTIWDEIQPFTLVIVDVETGKLVLEPVSSNSILYLSSNARYVLSERFSTSWERLPYQLEDRETREQWTVTGEGEPASFLSWSPDSRFILFGPSRETDDYAVLFTVDVETLARQVVTPEDKAGQWGAWSPDGQTIAYLQCDLPVSACDNAELWLMNPDGANRRPIPMGDSINRGPVLEDNKILAIEQLSWISDGSRLLFEAHNTFYQLHENIWSVRLDGTDLRPIADTNASWEKPLPLP
jgi:WD40 repeat protein